jgi:hypothetical protein
MHVSTHLIDTLSTPPALLILVAGFEERCLGVLDLIKDLSLKETQIIILTYQSRDFEITRANKRNEGKMKSFLRNREYSYREIKINHLYPFKTLHKLNPILEILKLEGLDIVFDISVCIDGLIPLLASHLLSLFPETLSFVYTRPGIYNIVKNYAKKDFSGLKKFYSDPRLRKQFMMTSGLDRVDFYEGIEGNPNPLYPYRIVFLAGFELNKVEAVCDQFSDSKKDILFGVSTLFDTKKELEVSKEIHDELDPALHVEKSTIENFDVQKILDGLNERIEGYPRENILICCFGTKPQLIASTLIALNKKEICLVRVLLKDYHPEFFSEGKSTSLFISISDFHAKPIPME